MPHEIESPHFAERRFPASRLQAAAIEGGNALTYSSCASEQQPPAFPRRRAVQVAVISMSVTVALMASSFAATADEEHWRDVKGAALRSLFKDQEFGDGVHFAYQFRSDGTFTGTEMAKEVSGSWRVRQNELCWNWLRPPGPRECYEVQQNGTHVRLLINGSEAWYGTLEKLR